MLQHQTHVQPQTNSKRGKGGDNKPRGRMTAYAFFVQTCREEHKKKHPEESVIFAEFSRKCADRWKVRKAKEEVTAHRAAVVILIVVGKFIENVLRTHFISRINTQNSPYIRASSLSRSKVYEPHSYAEDRGRGGEPRT